jgi:hypothetical protein
MKKIDTRGSSSISWAEYDEKEKVLHVGFVGNDTRYKYKQVPLRKIEELEKAGSKGEYINRHIKPFHDFDMDK